MRRQKNVITTILIVATVIAFKFFINETNIRSPIARSPSGLEDTAYVTHVEPEAVVEQKAITQSCDVLLLKKMSLGCDRECLANAVRPRDNELASFIEKESQLIYENPDLKLELSSKLARFHLSKSYGRDNEYSVDLLKKLSAEDKNNAFPAFHLAVKLMEVQRPSEALVVLKEALRRPEFTDYVSDYRKRLKMLTIHDERLYSAALHFLYDEASFSAAFDLGPLSELHEELRYSVARKMVAPAISDEGRGVLINWDYHHFELGKQWIEGVDPATAAVLEAITLQYSGDLEEFPHVPGFHCEVGEFQDYRLREQERLLSLR